MPPCFGDGGTKTPAGGVEVGGEKVLLHGWVSCYKAGDNASPDQIAGFAARAGLAMIPEACERPHLCITLV